MVAVILYTPSHSHQRSSGFEPVDTQLTPASLGHADNSITTGRYGSGEWGLDKLPEVINKVPLSSLGLGVYEKSLEQMIEDYVPNQHEVGDACETLYAFTFTTGKTLKISEG